MKKLFTLLLLFAVSLSAETRYLIVSGDKAKPIPARMKDKATHTIELTAEQMKVSGSPKCWKVVNGQPVLKTQAEIDAEDLANKKKAWKREAIRISDALKINFIIQNEGKKHEFNDHSQRLFLAQFMTLEKDIRIKVKGQKSIKVDKATAERIFAEIAAYQNQIEDALENDLDAMEAGTFTLSNLTAIQTAQEALKAE